MRDTRGHRISENLNHVVPGSVAAVRVSEVLALTTPTGITKDGDAENAYVKSDLEGEEVWGVPPKEVLPKDWDDDDVVQIVKALYGLKRAGLDWGTKVRRDAVELLGWIWIRDIGDSSISYTDLAADRVHQRLPVRGAAQGG